MDCRSKYQKLVPYPSTAEIDPADSTMTSPTIVRIDAGTNNMIRLVRFSAARSRLGARVRGARTTRRAGRTLAACLVQTVSRPAMRPHSLGQGPRRRGEPIAPLPVVAELIPARARGREENGSPRARHGEGESDRFLDGAGPSHRRGAAEDAVQLGGGFADGDDAAQSVGPGSERGQVDALRPPAGDQHGRGPRVDRGNRGMDVR